MNVVAKDLALVVDAVIDAHNIVAHIDGQTRLAEELIVGRVRLGNNSRIR